MAGCKTLRQAPPSPAAPPPSLLLPLSACQWGSGSTKSGSVLTGLCWPTRSPRSNAHSLELFFFFLHCLFLPGLLPASSPPPPFASPLPPTLSSPAQLPSRTPWGPSINSLLTHGCNLLCIATASRSSQQPRDRTALLTSPRLPSPAQLQSRSTIRYC